MKFLPEQNNIGKINYTPILLNEFHQIIAESEMEIVVITVYTFYF